MQQIEEYFGEKQKPERYFTDLGATNMCMRKKVISREGKASVAEAMQMQEQKTVRK